MISVAEVHCGPAVHPAGGRLPGTSGFPRQTVAWFGAADAGASLAALSYAVIPAAHWAELDAHRPLAAVISDGIDHPLALCASIPRHIPKILLARDHSFEIRRAAARAGVQAVVGWPAAINDVLEWLEFFEEQASVRASVLLIEDSAALAASYGLALQEAGLDVEIIDGPVAAIQALDRAVPDLIVVDIGLSSPDGVRDGAELAAIIRQSSTYLHVPIVFLSDVLEQDRRLPAAGVTGDMVIVHSGDAASLALEIKPRALCARARREAIERDPLTGLLHQASFDVRGAAELARCRRSGGACSLAILSIDRFHAINIHYGRPAGDRVLKTLSRLLRSRLRSTDLIAHLGGAEFAVLLPDTGPELARGVIGALRDAFDGIGLADTSASPMARFNVGIAGSHGLSWPKLRLAAEAALRSH